MPKRRVPYEAESTVLTFVHLKRAAEHAFDQGVRNPAGSFYSFLQSVLCTALAFEAYLNHLGKILFPFWNEIERSLSPSQKLTLVADRLAFTPDFAKAPFGAFPTLFAFRNALAHGKTETIRSQGTVPQEGFSIPWPQTNWEKLCVRSKARRALDDMINMVRALHGQAGQGDDPFSTLVYGSGRTRSNR